nr:unnamed protein product [Callosobruchus analis]
MHLNVQSLSNKTDKINLFIENRNLSLLCFPEHWLDYESLQLSKMHGYSLITTVGHLANMGEFECDSEFCSEKIGKTSTIFICIYRSCLSDFSTFLDWFEQLLIFLAGTNYKITISIDFNINFSGQSLKYP